MAVGKAALGKVEDITRTILVLRGRRVLLDAELAVLYGVTTRRLNEQVRRNRKRFPDDFLFELTTEEFANLKSRFATSSWGGRRKRPLAFTEHGAIQAATVLNSPRAVEISVYVRVALAGVGSYGTVFHTKIARITLIRWESLGKSTLSGRRPHSLT
ncbi:MAG: ORF6N domain-containing protein [Steroidobacteraceae bacterium]|jgi:hypothetical protein